MFFRNLAFFPQFAARCALCWVNLMREDPNALAAIPQSGLLLILPIGLAQGIAKQDVAIQW